MAVVPYIVEVPQQAVAFYIPCLERLVTSLIEHPIGHHSVGHICAFCLVAIGLLAACLVNPHQSLVGCGQNHIFLVHCGAGEEHGIGLVFPLHRTCVLIQRLEQTQRVSQIDVVAVEPQSGEDRCVIGIDACNGEAGREHLLWLGVVDLVEVAFGTIDVF